jgi:carboxypeptidase Taq
MKEYQALEKVFYEIAMITSINSMMGWDMRVMMPKNSVDFRSKQLEYLDVLAHSKLSKRSLRDKIYSVDDSKLNNWQKANLREMKRMVDDAFAIPARLVKELSAATSICEAKWIEARSKNDFKILKPYFERLLKLSKESAVIKGQFLNKKPYDALLDTYNAGSSTKDLDPIFDKLKQFLPGFIQKVSRQQKAPIKFEQTFSVKKQKQLGVHYMKLLGFDFNKGRLDVSTHPFCGGVPDDIRMTTRYYKDSFIPSFMGVLHETGHGLYEMNLPKDWRGQPVGRSCGMAIHESQSLFVEMQMCRSKEFIENYLPKAIELFDLDSHKYNTKSIFNIVNHVTPSFIRVDADEVTYPLHVIMRYELEKDLFADKLEVDDIFDAWNDKMVKYLGIKPETYSESFMQDIHWFFGVFGYFPCYTLGALTAAQLMHTLKAEMKGVDKKILTSDFIPIISWLTDKIHSKGCLYQPKELIKKATGEHLNSDYFIKYLENKYL